ncbi:hypothetical protein Q1695_012207 [Nippostrongylus brasiliensis]|nr:hypothetical protein Q1695_012207 [Nippostrongylus brasiliensis]
MKVELLLLFFVFCAIQKPTLASLFGKDIKCAGENEEYTLLHDTHCNDTESAKSQKTIESIIISRPGEEKKPKKSGDSLKKKLQEEKTVFHRLW